MDARDVRDKMTVEEVEQRLRETREELWRLRFRAATEQLENPLLLRQLRRDIARMLTILNEHRQGIRPLPERGEGTPS